MDSPGSLKTFRLIAAGVVVLALLSGWFVVGTPRERGIASPPAEATSDSIRVLALVEAVGASSNSADVTWWLKPEGTLNADGAPTQEVVLSAPNLSETDATLRAGSQPTTHTATIDLTSGDSAAYPFDRYGATVHLSATAGGQDIPVNVTMDSADQGFRVSGTLTGSEEEPVLSISLRRSTSAIGMAILMFVIMWALAIAVATAAWIIVHKRSGLVWPAMGWMAATLFALVAFRNAAPGSPPIGCLLDIAGFFWAEAIVALSLVTVVIKGAPLELRKP